MATINTPPTDWGAWALQFLPRRFSDSGIWANFFGLMVYAPADVTAQGIAEAAMARSQTSPTFPADAIDNVIAEGGLDGFPNESLAQQVSRVQGKWGFWPTVGIKPTLVSQLSYVCTLQGVSASITLVTEDDTHKLPGGGHPEWNIPYWPTSPWWSQFIVVITLPLPMGAGAEGRSVLLNDSQLAAIQRIVKRFSPAQWAPREILIQSGSMSNVWDQAGLTWDSGIHWDVNTGLVQERYHTIM